MKKTTLMLLASAALALPGALPAMAQNTPANQTPQAQSSGQSQAQNQQPQGQDQQTQGQNQQAQGQDQQAQEQNEQGQSIPANQLGRRGVRQVQQALNKSGHHVGRPDGIMGRRTREALQRFQKSKGMQASGKINQQTLADLGVQLPGSNQQNNNQPNQNQNNAGGNASPGTNQ